MRPLRKLGHRAFTALLCLALAVWSVLPVAPHAVTGVEAFRDHAAIVADHGHSHELEADFYWKRHGHSHDAADHDHSQAVLTLREGPAELPGYRDVRRIRHSPAGRSRKFRIERPPRA